MVEVMRMSTPSKGPMHTLLYSVPPTLQLATANPRLCWRLLDTYGQVCISLLWDQRLLSPGSWCTQGSICALQESVSPVLCKFWQLYGWLVATSSKRAYAIHKSAAGRAPAPVADLYLLRRHQNTVLSQSLWGPWALVCTKRV